MHVLTIDFNESNAPKLFTESLLNTGFAVVANHPIMPELIHTTYHEWTDFFSSSDKFNYLFDKEKQDGYFPLSISETAKGNDIKDLKEFYHIYPQGRYPKNLSQRTKELYKNLNNLAQILLQWIDSNTPTHIAENFSMPLSQMIIDSDSTLLRVLHYPALQGNEEQGAIRAAAHEDINLITLLVAATTPGLQVQDTLGNWHHVECDPGTIVVNTGDMLQMCSNNYYRSTTHRVINPAHETANESRLSMPLFLHPNPNVRLSSTHTAAEYLYERLKEIGLKD